MRKLGRRIWFMVEPYRMYCPRCDALMKWSQWQGPLGGWTCPDCGLVIDHK